jgi:hypothetical protein
MPNIALSCNCRFSGEIRGRAPRSLTLLLTIIGLLTAEELTRAQAIVDGFNAARARGEDRALVNGLWVEVPTYRNAVRLIERAHRLGLST